MINKHYISLSFNYTNENNACKKKHYFIHVLFTFLPFAATSDNNVKILVLVSLCNFLLVISLTFLLLTMHGTFKVSDITVKLLNFNTN